MANRKIILPQYGTVMKRGVLYYRTRIKDANGKLVAIYAKTPEELYNKETLALEQIENATFHRKTPTVAEYCEKWLLMQSVHVRATTLTDYTSKVRRHIIAELGDKRMGEVSLDDIQLALVPVSKKSASVYKSVVILYKSIFRAAMESRIIDHEDGKRVKHTVTPVLGEKAAHNGKVVYSLDFEVTPHQLRHTYITNLIHASIDPKTVQYLAGHESSKITMDIYAKVKYNRPDELVRSMSCAFASWDAAQ